MALFTRSRLARGVKLARERVFNLLSSISTQIGALTIGRENYAESNAPFWVHLHVPQLDKRFFGRSVAGLPGDMGFPIPFVLPPLQQFFDTTGRGQTSQATPRLVLDAITFSFDQRAEAAVIVNDTGGGGAAEEAFLNFNTTNGTDVLQIRLSLLEKTPRVFGGTAPWLPEREVFSVTLPPEAFLSNTFKAGNPFQLTGLNKQIDPYKTYVLVLACPTWSATHNLTLPAIHFGLRFKHPIVAQTVNDGTILPQNMPIALTTRVGRTVAITTPVNDQHISAEVAAGVHTNMNTVDTLLRNRLEAGWSQDGAPSGGTVAAAEDLAAGSAYHVIAVPMWTNFGLPQAFTAANAATAPYVGVAPYASPTVDRRLVEIDFPFVLHHVVAGVNYCRPRGNGGNIGAHPTSASLANDIGVAMLTGVRGDHWAYQLLAFDSWTVATKAARNIDRIRFAEFGQELSSSATEPWDVELLQVPLVRRAGAGQVGRSYFATSGWPIYIGRGTNTSTGYGGAARSSMGADTAGGATVTSLTKGCEQLIEVRWAIRDAVGLAFGGGGAAGSADDVYAGQGGHWIFLIGETPLVRATGDVPV